MSLYRDLTIVFSGRVPRRSEEYLQRQRDGKLDLYHTRLMATDRQKIERHVVNEVRYLSVATPDVANDTMQSVHYVYPVSKVELVKRSMLAEEKTGTRGITNPNEDYWLFTLGEAIDITVPLKKMKSAHFEVLLTGLNQLRTVRKWEDLPQRYPLLSR